jgi:kynurenine formamidase
VNNRDANLSASEFELLFEDVCSWGRWGKHDERGALNELGADRVRAACGLVQAGRTVGLGLPVNTHAGLANPSPAVHRMTMLADTDIGSGTLRFAKDYVGVDYHNDGHSHIDALCHVAFNGVLYNALPAGSVTADGATAGTIDVAKDGVVGRGVLLDVPAVRGVPWLEPGEHIFRDDLESAEREEGVRVAVGDVLLIRTGHQRRLADLGPWDTTTAKAGLHPTVAPFLSERRIAVLGSDGNSDTAPSTTEGVAFPIHVLALNAMGVHLLDYLQLEDLAVACEHERRWEFLFLASPLRIARGTGSPLNPVAIF